MTVREQCENCLSFNYLADNLANIGYEAFECWNCNQRQFLPDDGLYMAMDRLSVGEADASRLLETCDLIIADGRAVP